MSPYRMAPKYYALSYSILMIKDAYAKIID